MITMSRLDLRDDLRRRYGKPSTSVPTGGSQPASSSRPDGAALERAFVLHAESGRTVITAPLRQIASANPAFTYLNGRLVGADEPNRNGAMWSTADLQMGSGSVAGGPLNWLHDDRKIIGCLLNGDMVTGEKAGSVGNHISSKAAVWSFLYPHETTHITQAAADGQLFYSMECIARDVACVDSPGRPGCGEVVSYGDYDADKCCAHLRERSSIRRFIDPLFLGAAVIIPPVQPGWAHASVEIARQAAAATEDYTAPDSITEAQAREVAAAVLSWANRAAT